MPVSLTIYNQGTSLVRDRRTITLENGQNTLDFTDVAARIDASSVTFRSITDPNGTLVLEQNYLYDLVGGSALLRRYLDEKIEITTEDGERLSGHLLSTGDIILRLADGQVVHTTQDKIRDIRFPNLPGGLITRPTLRWLLQSSTAGEQDIELTYLTGGLNWSADYNLLLATDNQSFDLNGWVTFENISGASYTDAQVKLIAGDVKRLPDPNIAQRRLSLDMARGMAAPAPQVEQREVFEYQLYEIGRAVSVANNETKQVEFITRHGTPAQTFYIYDASSWIGLRYGGEPYLESNYGFADVRNVKTFITFSTGKEAGLDADLPAGRMRVYQNDTDGSAVLIGENPIKHTPKGEEVRFELGNAFDLVGERKQTNFRQLSKNVIEETHEIRLRSRKETQRVEIRVPERLFRWSNWEILASSDPYTKLNASTIEFRVTVGPGEEKVITYTARYNWPR
jgi:hypothetical protein